MNEIIKKIIGGYQPTLEELLEVLTKIIPLISKLPITYQDNKWHEEGNVWIHTNMVLKSVYKIINSEAKHLTNTQKATLILSAVLHDIGKPIVTKKREINGQMRIVSPRHEIRGCSYIAFRLLDLDIPYEIIYSILSLVAYHHKPKILIIRGSPIRKFFQLARFVNIELLYYLAKADILGRICENQSEQLDIIELFKLYCIDYGLWKNIDPYKEWREYILSETSNENTNFFYRLAVFDYESGIINSPYEVIPRYYRFMNNHANLVCFCGVSGSGKTEWIKKHFSAYEVISLDQLRKKIAKNISDQSKNKQVYIEACKQLKRLLAQNKNIVWDATNLRKDFRRFLFNLGRKYNAFVTFIVFHEKISNLKKSNLNRKDPVSDSVFQDQINRFEWVEKNEAHSVKYINNYQLMNIW